MHIEIKQRWIHALRSGKYTQSAGKLKDCVGYCCLGVLAKEVLGEGELLGYRWDDANGAILNEYGVKYEGLLAPDLAQYLNLDQRFDGTEITDVQSYLSKRNDQGATFEQIADWIERNL